MIDIEKMMASVEPTRFDIIESEDIPRFPIEIFPEEFQFVIQQMEKYFQFEYQTTSASLLFVASTIIGNNRKLIINDGWSDTPNLWISIVGKRGTMKSPTISFVLKALNSDEKDYAREFNLELAEWNALSKKQKENTPRPRRRQRFSNDTTVEGLIHAMEYNWRGMGLYKDELNGFFDELNRYQSGGNLEFYLAAFNGGTYVKNRRTYDPLTVNDIFLSMLGSIQPEILKKLASMQTQNGMLDRWLYVISSDRIPKTILDSPDNDLNVQLFQYVSNMKEFTKTPENMEWLPGAKYAFQSFVNEIEIMMEKEEDLLTYLSKMKTYFVRFIIIICVIDRTDLVGIPQINKAALLIAYFIGTAQHTFVGFENQLTLERICDIEKAKTKKEIIIAVSKHLPDLNNSQIARLTNISRRYVIKIVNKV